MDLFNEAMVDWDEIYEIYEKELMICFSKITVCHNPSMMLNHLCHIAMSMFGFSWDKLTWMLRLKLVFFWLQINM
jgi:hypothetical protein